MKISYTWLNSENLTNEGIAELNALLEELTPGGGLVDRETWQHVIDAGTVRIAIDETPAIVGIAILTTAILPRSRRGTIDSVVVRKDRNRLGIGLHLIEDLIQFARAMNLTTLKLTSRLTRTEAHRLYLRAGFEPVETRVFSRAL